MRSIALIAGLAALAVASPMPQQYPGDALLDYDDPPMTDVDTGAGTEIIPLDVAAIVAAAVVDIKTDSSPDVAADDISAVLKRSLKERTPGDCAAQPAGYGPTYPQVANDATSFQNYQGFADAANGATTPYGYVNTFTNYKASVSACAYMGYKTYKTYDVGQAAADCSKITGCKGFNIFFERDPTQDPGPNCPNPYATTVIKASFWGNVLGPATATNKGQYRNQFQVVIAGSNAYNAEQCETPVSGFTQKYLNNCAIQAKGTSCSGKQTDSYLTMKQFTDGVLDHNRCKAQCDIITAQSPDTPCRFFTSYLQVKNGQCGVQQCAFYKRAWDSEYCTNTGQTVGKDVITIKWSSSFTSNTNDGVADCPVTTSYFRR